MRVKIINFKTKSKVQIWKIKLKKEKLLKINNKNRNKIL